MIGKKILLFISLILFIGMDIILYFAIQFVSHPFSTTITGSTKSGRFSIVSDTPSIVLQSADTAKIASLLDTVHFFDPGGHRTYHSNSFDIVPVISLSIHLTNKQQTNKPIYYINKNNQKNLFTAYSDTYDPFSKKQSLFVYVNPDYITSTTANTIFWTATLHAIRDVTRITNIPHSQDALRQEMSAEQTFIKQYSSLQPYSINIAK